MLDVIGGENVVKLGVNFNGKMFSGKLMRPYGGVLSLSNLSGKRAHGETGDNLIWQRTRWGRDAMGGVSDN